MRKYSPNPKHEGPGLRGRKGTRLDLSSAEAGALLNDPDSCIRVPGKSQFVAVKGGRIYAFQGDDIEGYHAYPVTGYEVYTKYPAVAKQVATLLGTDVQRLSRMHE